MSCVAMIVASTSFMILLNIILTRELTKLDFCSPWGLQCASLCACMVRTY